MRKRREAAGKPSTPVKSCEDVINVKTDPLVETVPRCPSLSLTVSFFVLSDILDSSKSTKSVSQLKLQRLYTDAFYVVKTLSATLTQLFLVQFNTFVFCNINMFS